ncbi:Unknown protein [Striga hermonthica]|uniref:Uncharacterized protein n=1 Tax=Striga hermonthica TaxID=68872 RepID=A0A9N7RGF7_STRHE|nr:Unknown protein [Striga hermonthica]
MLLSKILLRAPRQGGRRAFHTDTGYGLLFKKNRTAFSMGVRDGRVESTETRPQPTSGARTDSSETCLAFKPGPSPNEVRLTHHPSGETVDLPPLARLSKVLQMESWGAAGHKVVVYFPPDPYALERKDEFHVITVGDESWRVVLSEPRVSAFAPALITEGFVHWSTKDDKVLSMNLETEAFTESPGPAPKPAPRPARDDDSDDVIVKNTYLSTGRYLSLLRQWDNNLFEVWEMSPDTFAWKKTGHFSLVDHESKFESTDSDGAIIPIGWVKYLEVLVLCPNMRGKTILVYNLVTRKMKTIELANSVCYYNIHTHKL